MKEQKAEYKNHFTLRCYTRKELAELYKIPVITIRRWIKTMPLELGMKGIHVLDIAQVKAIVEKYGIPGEIILK